MHEHVGHQLIDVEVGCIQEMQTQHIAKVDAPTLSRDHGKIHDDVDDDQVLGSRRSL